MTKFKRSVHNVSLLTCHLNFSHFLADLISISSPLTFLQIFSFFSFWWVYFPYSIDYMNLSVLFDWQLDITFFLLLNSHFYSKSFIARTSHPWNSLPIYYFNVIYNIQKCKNSVNRHHLSSWILFHFCHLLLTNVFAFSLLPWDPTVFFTLLAVK